MNKNGLWGEFVSFLGGGGEGGCVGFFAGWGCYFKVVFGWDAFWVVFSCDEVVCGLGEKVVCGVGEKVVCGVGEKMVCGVGEKMVCGVDFQGLRSLLSAAFVLLCLNIITT